MQRTRECHSCGNRVVIHGHNRCSKCYHRDYKQGRFQELPVLWMPRSFKSFYAAWMDEALCAQTDPELWFPENKSSSEPAKAICSRCPVKADCLEYVTLIEQHIPAGYWDGVYAGLSARDRRKMKMRVDAA